MTYPCFPQNITKIFRHPTHKKVHRPVQLFIIRGIPGSGKSTFAKKLSNTNGHMRIVENDDFFTDHSGKYRYNKEIYDYAKQYTMSAIVHELMIEKKACIVTGVFYHADEASDLLNIINFCKAHNIPFEVHRMTGNFQNIHNIPEEVLEEMKENFEPYDGEIMNTSHISRIEGKY